METIRQVLRKELGCTSVDILSGSGLSVLNHCIACNTDKGKFFVKCNESSFLHMYEAEKYALGLIAATQTIRTPHVYWCGESHGLGLLVLEYIDLCPHTKKSYEILGRKLAQLHTSAKSQFFGFDIDNTIGTTPQFNTWSDDWTKFFSEHRLGFLLQELSKKYDDDDLIRGGNQLIGRVPEYTDGVVAHSSLLHGDLWCGNTAADCEGNPVIFDPASYYGHDECDLSIAMMFGGFDPSFYSAYHEVIPKKPGFTERNLLYQLYHYLNHYLLFGTSYRGSCLAILQKFC